MSPFHLILPTIIQHSICRRNTLEDETAEGGVNFDFHDLLLVFNFPHTRDLRIVRGL